VHSTRRPMWAPVRRVPNLADLKMPMI